MKLHEFLNEGNWTKGAFARNSSGLPVLWSSDSAVRFCLHGAVKRIGLPYGHLRTLSEWTPLGATAWNDAPERTFAEVHAKLKELDL